MAAIQTLPTDLVSLREMRKVKRNELQNLYKEMGSDYNIDNIKSITGDSEVKINELRSRDAELAEIGTRIEVLTIGERANQPDITPEVLNQNQRQSFGEAFVNSNIFKERTPKISTPEFTLPMRLNAVFGEGWNTARFGAAAQTGYAAAGLPVPPQMSPGGFLQDIGWKPRTLLDIIPTIPVSSGSFQYPKQTTQASATAHRAEGATLAENTIVYDYDTVVVRSIGSFIPVTEEVLEDEAMTRGLIDEDLRNDLWDKIHHNLLRGDNVAPNINGLINQAVATASADSGLSGTGTQTAVTMLEAVHKMATKVEDDGFVPPDYAVMRSGDWETLRLAKDGNENYLLGAAIDSDRKIVWGIPVITTADMLDSSIMVGAFRFSARIFDRAQPSIQIGYVGNNFTDLEVTIRAHARLAVAVRRPKAIQKSGNFLTRA